MLSNFIFNSWFNNFPSSPPPTSRSVSLFSNAASSNFVFLAFPSPPRSSITRNKQKRNTECAMKRERKKQQQRKISQHFVCHCRVQVRFSFILLDSSSDNEMNSVIFIFLLYVFYDANLKEYTNIESFPSFHGVSCLCGLRLAVQEGNAAEDSLFLIASNLEYFLSLFISQAAAACWISLGPKYYAIKFLSTPANREHRIMSI